MKVFDALADLSTLALFVSAIAAFASVFMLLRQTRFRMDSTVIITKLEITALYLLFGVERLTAGMNLVADGVYLYNLLSVCAKLSLAGALCVSCVVMYRRLHIIRKGGLT